MSYEIYVYICTVYHYIKIITHREYNSVIHKSHKFDLFLQTNFVPSVSGIAQLEIENNNKKKKTKREWKTDKNFSSGTRSENYEIHR